MIHNGSSLCFTSFFDVQILGSQEACPSSCIWAQWGLPNCYVEKANSTLESATLIACD